MRYKYDKNKIKETLEIGQIEELVAEFGGEPISHGNYLICKTICHCGESHKLYYYENTHLFKCYTECAGDSFDIFELVCKIKNIAQEPKTYYTSEGKVGIREWELYDAVEFVAIYFNLANEVYNFDEDGFELKLNDWEILDRYEIKQKEKTNNTELKIYDDKILKFLPHPRIGVWENEGISKEVLDAHDIAYDPRNGGIVIPHYDINGNLVGIRERTVVKENEIYGKYKPAILNGQMYNHPLGFLNYNLNISKENIKTMKKVIVFEGEKSCLKMGSMFGLENDISVAVCGSSMTMHQFNQLLSLGIDEIIFAFDKQYKQIGDEEWLGWIKKLKTLSTKFKSYCKVSFMFDIDNLLEYKMSPIDSSKEVFLELFKRRLDADGR